MKINNIKLLLFAALLFGGCVTPAEDETKEYLTLRGNTMGTVYSIKADTDLNGEILKVEVDSLLASFNDEVSTYIPNSTISQFNEFRDSFLIHKQTHAHFYRNLMASFRIYDMTQGFFDPTVMPLVNYWGFGYEPRDESLQVDSGKVDSLVSLVGLEKIDRKVVGDSLWLIKSDPAMKLDFSAIAKGDGVDLVSNLLKARGIKNFMVEIGGEVYSEGKNPTGQDWVIGINRPAEDADHNELIKKVKIAHRGLATSGNYRNFYKVGGQVYSHTINPKSGYTERNTIVSASVISEDCKTADALATACMTMGEERIKKLAPQWSKTAVFLIYQQDGELKYWSTREFDNYIIE